VSVHTATAGDSFGT